MKVGMIDLDMSNRRKLFPNLALMKLSQWHKMVGDTVGWYNGDHCDLVYVSKVFSFSPEPEQIINADKVIYGGSGFAISVVDGVEVYDKSKDKPLPYEIEHIYPDYSLYGITDTAYGFLQRGCPRCCDFCHVGKMQGVIPHKVADIGEFWNGQKKIVLLDPNITAFCGWKDVFQQLIDTGAEVDFSQGLDIRCMTEEKIEMLKRIRFKCLHFAWDRYQESEMVKRKLKQLKDLTGWDKHKVMVYVLTNFDTTLEQDIERVMYLRSLNFQPYIMRYDKEHIKKGSMANALARWVNFVPLFWKYETFDDYLRNERKSLVRND